MTEEKEDKTYDLEERSIFSTTIKKTERSDTTLRHSAVRPARNALKLVRGKLNNLIHHTMLTLTQRTLHGRRVFDILRFDIRHSSVRFLDPSFYTNCLYTHLHLTSTLFKTNLIVNS